MNSDTLSKFEFKSFFDLKNFSEIKIQKNSKNNQLIALTFTINYS